MAARDLRYRYFEQLRLDIGASNICVAHHQDDATETLLMNLIRGTGIHGLTGIRPRNGHVVRPLLCVSRSDILSFLETAQQDYITDSSNLVADVVRNKLRLEVIPLLRTINPAAASNIAKTAQRMAEVERIYDNAVKAEARRLLKDDTISIADLLNSQAPESLLFEMLTPCGFTSAQVEQLFACLNTQTGRMFLSDTHQAAIDRGRLIIEKRQATLPTMRIPEPGTYRLTDNIKFGFRLTDDAQISKEPQQATLDADNTPFPLTIRPLQTGDRFQPFGMKGSRLLSDFLTDRKLSVLEKQRQLVITDAEGRIVWVVGQRIDQRFAVNNQTRRTLTITLLPSE
jgi:tRNA(Ile)-lysidine synthase